MKKIMCLVLVLIMMCPVTVFANSAPTRWRGSDATGIITMEEGCPVKVTKEVLTFDIQSFPEEYYSETEQFAGAGFTARYTLHNPTDMDIVVRVLFPFGQKGDYYSDKFMTDSNFVEKNYRVEVDGQSVETKRRYTFFPYNYDEFDINRQLEKLSDDFSGDDFFHPKQRVIKYVVNCIEGDENKELRLEWENKNDGSYLYTGDYHKGKYQEKSVMLWTDYNDDFVYYIIGEGENRPIVKLYTKGEENLPQGKTVEDITTRKEMTLAEFADEYLKNNFDGLDVADNDRDNIIRDIFKYNSKGHEDRAFADNLNYYNIPSDLMCWYDYEIEIPAGGTVVNTVTAPLFPDVDTGYEPDIYTYNYLLSPAKRWSGFENLEVVINTPYYITESSIDFEKTETGYKSTFNTLPDEELSVTISRGENPKKETNYRYLVMFLPILAMPIAVAVALIVVIRYALKKRK